MAYLELRLPALRTPDLRTIDVLVDGEPAGSVELRVCEQCELVTVEDVRLPAELAVPVLRLLVERLPHHRWTGSSAHAPGFWDTLPWWQGSRMPERCQHMRTLDALPAQRGTEAAVRDEPVAT